MALEEIKGQAAAVRYLRGLLASGVFPQAMLFSGPPGVGKRTAALAFGRDLLCLRGPGAREGACGECESCRLLAGGTHPDMVVVGADRKRKELRLDDVQSFSMLMSLKPLFERKCAVLIDSERMNAHAQNSLLKALEEPPPSTVFCLTSSNPEALLETVRSRCALVRFRPLAAEVLAEILGVADGEATRLFAASSGSVRLARAALEGRELTEKAKELYAALAGEATRVLHCADAFAEAAKKAGAVEAATALLSAERERLVRSPDDPTLQEALGEVIRAVKALRSNVRVKLVMRCLAWKLRNIPVPKAIQV